MKQTGAWTGGLLLFAAGLGSGWAVRTLMPASIELESTGEDEDEAPAIVVEPADMRVLVSAVEASSGSLPITLSAPGFVRASPASLHALASRAGGRVLEVTAVAGQPVLKGELLFSLDPAPAQTALSQARSTLADCANRLAEFERNGAARQRVELEASSQRAIGQVALLEAQVRRLEPLRTDGLVSDKALAEARQALDSARAERVLSENAAKAFRDSGENLQLATLTAARDAARLSMDEAERAFAEVSVRAPLDGRLLEVSVRAGELLAAGSSLGTLLDESGRELVFQVPASAQAQIRVGAVATWLDAQGVASQGTIARIDAQVEASAGTLEVVAKPDQESAALLMGLRVMGEIELRRTPTGILVPEQAVLRRLDAQVVLVVRDGKATNVPVRVLGRHGGLAAIEGDVHEHEQVIVEGGYNLPEGAGVVLRSGQ